MDFIDEVFEGDQTNVAPIVEESSDNDGRLSLVLAAKKGDWTKVEQLIKHMSKRDRRLNASLPETGETTLMIACQQSRFLVVDKLCAIGASINLRSNVI